MICKYVLISPQPTPVISNETQQLTVKNTVNTVGHHLGSKRILSSEKPASEEITTFP